jgi:hypothetical protein
MRLIELDYKKVIKSQDMRFRILGLLDFLPDKLMIQSQYRIKTGRNLNLKKPERFTEKLQWYKLYYRNPLMTKCADKYRVREYIIEKGYDDILIPLYGDYENADQINFNNLPDEFVLKTTNGSHTNIICKDKSKLNINQTIRTLNSWIKDRPVKLGREWAYYDIEPRIICEQYLKDEGNIFEGINDYKFICFDGEVKYIWIDVNRYVDHRRNFYDINWNYIDIRSDVPNYGDSIAKPDGLNEMIKIANALSKDFPHVRVDLYWINNRVYFGELTFYLLSGYEDFEPDEFDFILGEEFKLPVLNKK